MIKFQTIFIFLLTFFFSVAISAQRTVVNLNRDWKFFLGDDEKAKEVQYDDSPWRVLHLPHDWSIEGEFSDQHPTTYNQAALPAGIGWYRKTFTIPANNKNKRVFINFDGIYKNSEVWINGHYLGKRPNGYISFRYELSSYLKFGSEKNLIAVKVDNSAQPDSRWYTGSGIYRKVWLETTNKIAVDHWGSFITTPTVSNSQAVVNIETTIAGSSKKPESIKLVHQIFDAGGKLIFSTESKPARISITGIAMHRLAATISHPQLWSVNKPLLYKAVTRIMQDGKTIDSYETKFGIRYFHFDAAKGFFLNGQPLKILGVCNHHDLGALGAAVNKRAIERQLQLLKAMGCNAIRTAHNPPATELLELCDQMGFIVMDEAFDIWKKKKNKFDYSVDFDTWHKQDLGDQIKRDRNHPSVFMWSIGNEIREQFDSSGINITKELVDIIKSFDTTRPVTCALTENVPEKNFIYQSGSLDLLGFNYKLNDYKELPKRFPGQKFIATEVASALATRGHYDFPSDSNRIWPHDSKPFTNGNADLTVSAYDHVFAYWGSTHEAAWLATKKNDFMSGLFVWSGFDFLGEPVPYRWPARSSYYGIIDLAGFPKDVYYMYQSEWTNKPMLHIFPHWNLPPNRHAGDSVDVWAYYNQADEVELFLNGKSVGTKRKQGDSLHVMWRLPYQPGTLKAVSRRKGKIISEKQIRTAGNPERIQLTADKNRIKLNGEDLSFVTVKILDKDGNLVPHAHNLVKFSVKGEGLIVGVDNGNPASLEPFKAIQRKAFNGLCLAIVGSTGKPGKIIIEATSAGLRSSVIRIN